MFREEIPLITTHAEVTFATPSPSIEVTFAPLIV